MKGLKIFLLLIIIITFLCPFVLYGENPPSEVGRFQLFQGTYKTYNIKTQQSDTSTGIFLIDTKTGEVKRYLNKIDEEGKYIETWVPTEMLSPPPQVSQKPKTTDTKTETIIYVIATKQSHIREEASIKSKSLRIITPGTKMEKLDEKNNMFKVKLPSGLIGWIDKSLTKAVIE